MRDILAALAVVACLVPASGALAPANAFGAIAVGQTANGVARDGVAIGTAWSYPTADEARARALSECQSYQPAPEAAKQCKVVGTLNAKQCYGISLDPKPGTPGVGWAIADDKATAEQQALAKCKETAGADRVQFCEVSESNCDGQ